MPAAAARPFAGISPLVMASSRMMCSRMPRTPSILSMGALANAFVTMEAAAADIIALGDESISTKRSL